MASTPSPAGDDFDDIYSTTPPNDPPPGPLASKRKSSNQPDESYAVEKRPKVSTLASQRVDLSPILWQRILRLLSPTDLARVCLVNRFLNACLTDADSLVPSVGLFQGNYCHHDVVWQASRSVHHPELPFSHPPFSEQLLWQLLSKKSCQFCGKLHEPPSGPPSPLAAGPGPDGVRVVWQFAVISCGPCLRDRITPTDKLMATFDAYHVATLPFIHLTASNNIIPSSALRDGLAVPAEEGKRKMIWTHDLEDAKSAGGMPKDAYDAKKKLMLSSQAKAEHWEEWELAGGMLRLSLHRTVPEILNPRPQQPIRALVHEPSTDDAFTDDALTPALSPEMAALSPAQARSVRFEALRRAEIERRCIKLEPPITPKLLDHMPAFHANMQIKLPMDDAGWKVLEPRLVAERAPAQRAVEARRRALTTSDMSSLDDGSCIERFNELQKPIRDTLSNYVDEFMQISGFGRESMDWNTAADFAASALYNARLRFASEYSESISLRLADMKWLFDNKIKPLTKDIRNDLFRCKACPNKVKWFSFPTLIRHFASTHTTSYSEGNVLVAWHAAPWPVRPPFRVGEDNRPWPFRNRPANDQSRHHSQSQATSPAEFAHTARQEGSFATPAAFWNTTGGYLPPQAPVGPYHPYQTPTAPSYLEYYVQNNASPTAPYPGPYANHAGYQQSPSPAFSNSSGFMAPASPYMYGHGTPFDGHGPYPGASPRTPAGYWHAGPQPPQPITQYPPMHPSSHAPSPAQGGVFFHAQVESVAEFSFEVFHSLFPIKNMPPSVRLHTMIQHTVASFRMKFQNEPNFDLFSHCIKTHGNMQNIARTTGIACKMCVTSRASRSGDRVLFSFVDLLHHFQQAHLANFGDAHQEHSSRGLRRPDWKTDMIELPSDELILRLSNAPNMQPANVQFLQQAFPALPIMALASGAPLNADYQAAPSFGAPSGPSSVHDAYATDALYDPARPNHLSMGDSTNPPRAGFNDEKITDLLRDLSNDPRIRALAKP